MPGIAEWDESGQSGKEEKQAWWSGTYQDVAEKVAWISIISEWSMGVKERHGS